MKFIYKTKSTGYSHIKSKKPCQDELVVEKNEDGYIILAVADGVGSCRYAEIASRAASHTCANYCKKALKADMNDSEVLNTMRTSFLLAEAKTHSIAEKKNRAYHEYETTLCMAVILNNHLYYGQSGDSGIIALLQEGHYITVTKQQRDEMGYVFPLSFGEPYWMFDHVEQPVSGVLLMTDGIWENLVPPILEGRDPCVNVPLLEIIMNHFEDSEDELNGLEEKMEKYWENFPVDYLSDDKTTIVYIDTEYRPERLDESYYAIPDWDAILKEKQDIG